MSKAAYAEGDEIEFKTHAGLGGWRRGTVSQVGNRAITISERGKLIAVPRKQVRRPKAPRVAPLHVPETPKTVPVPPRPAMRPPPMPAALRAVPKPSKPARSRDYLAYVRTHPCCVCGNELSEAHHFGPRGTGQKTDDYRTVPLCAGCHTDWHRTGRIENESRAESERRFYAVQVNLLVAWMEAA